MPDLFPNVTPELLSALAEVQRTAGPVPETGERDDSGGKFRYARGRVVVDHGRKALHDGGLTLVLTETTVHPSQLEGDKGRGVVTLRGFLLHTTSGGTLPVLLELPYLGGRGRPDDNAALGSITKGEARLVRLLLAMTTTDDDALEEPAAEAQPEAKAPPVKPAPVPTKPAPEPAPAESAPVEPAKPKAAPAPAAKTDGQHSRLPAPGAALDPHPSPAEDVERFQTLAKRLKLDDDAAVCFASRVPEGGKLKATHGTRHDFAGCVRDGVIGVVADELDAAIADMKARKVNPVKSGFSEAVTAWAAEQIKF